MTQVLPNKSNNPRNQHVLFVYSGCILQQNFYFFNRYFILFLFFSDFSNFLRQSAQSLFYKSGQPRIFLLYFTQQFSVKKKNACGMQILQPERFLTTGRCRLPIYYYTRRSEYIYGNEQGFSMGRRYGCQPV